MTLNLLENAIDRCQSCVIVTCVRYLNMARKRRQAERSVHVPAPCCRQYLPFLYSHGGLDALKHLKSLGYDTYELMIFPPHCWPRELTVADKRDYKAWLNGEAGMSAASAIRCSTTIRTAWTG
jgi:hypothetical protein